MASMAGILPQAYHHPQVNKDKLYQIYAGWLIQQHCRIGIVPWQIGDWHFLDREQECCILRSRGGSKTTDLMDWLLLRVWCTREKWGWLTPKGGQKVEASIHLRCHPFFDRFVQIEERRFIQLKNGSLILFGIISESNLGLRLDGLIIDEEENMESKQTLEVYPQMAGMLSVSKIAKQIHAGTRWIDTEFDKNCDSLPVSIHDHTQCPWINQSFIARQILARPAWEIDLLYRCLRTVPGGLVFRNIKIEPVDELMKHSVNVRGIDINQTEAVVEGYLEPGHLWILNEFEADFVHQPEVFYKLKTQSVATEIEDGGYNSKEAEILQQALGCLKQLWDVNTKSERMTQLRSTVIHMNRTKTPNVCADVETTVYDPKTGLYFKHPVQHPCHWLDALLHAIGALKRRFLNSPEDEKYISTGSNHIDGLIAHKVRH